MKVSIITAVYNREKTIQSTIDSVVQQDYANIEHVVVDGGSTDGTIDVINQNSQQIDQFVTGPDNGIYDALNKGIELATGDVVGFLHADDVLHDSHAVERIVNGFQENKQADFVYGDLLYVDAKNPLKVVRYWKSGKYSTSKIRWGWMPAHPTFYLKREKYSKLGAYRDDFEISADYELMIRMIMRHQLQGQYVSEILVDMKVGGKSNSSLTNRKTANREDKLAWKVNQLTPPRGLRFWKPLRKLPQYFLRPPK